MKPSILAKAVTDEKLAEVNFKILENQVNDDDLVIGMMMKQLAHKFLDDGDITENQLKAFYAAVRAFFIQTTDYFFKWCPLQDKLLIHST